MTAEQLTLPLVFLSGILGSAHCIGMCGGISATMSLGADRLRTAVGRQLFWSCGRIFTYLFLGVAAATVGRRVVISGGNTVLAQAAFAVVAGLLLILQGLHAAGWLRWRIGPRAAHPCLTTSILAQFLKGGSLLAVFVAGILTGFLPCGLVYSFLALAASSGSVLQGVLIMLCFGLGTIPVMLVTGTGFSMATVNTRRQLLKLAACCVIVTGVMTMGRGIAFAAGRQHAPSEIAACPLCSDGSVAGSDSSDLSKK